MTDREMLERAAKAACLTLFEHRGSFYLHPVDDRDACKSWNPLEDDGDVARLEAELELPVRWWNNCVTVNNGVHGNGATEFYAEHGGDKQAARRYASVRAAAAMAPGEG